MLRSHYRIVLVSLLLSLLPRGAKDLSFVVLIGEKTSTLPWTSLFVMYSWTCSSPVAFALSISASVSDGATIPDEILNSSSVGCHGDLILHIVDHSLDRLLILQLSTIGWNMGYIYIYIYIRIGHMRSLQWSCMRHDTNRVVSAAVG